MISCLTSSLFWRNRWFLRDARDILVNIVNMVNIFLTIQNSIVLLSLPSLLFFNNIITKQTKHSKSSEWFRIHFSYVSCAKVMVMQTTQRLRFCEIHEKTWICQCNCFSCLLLTHFWNPVIDLIQFIIVCMVCMYLNFFAYLDFDLPHSNASLLSCC